MPEIFCLVDANGKPLEPAVQATVLAKYSRSPLSAKRILDNVTPEEADKFQKKWAIDWGHSSVAELCTLAICLEGVSIVASKWLEQMQRAGYSEKSTRYQVFTKDSFVTPKGYEHDPSIKKFAERFYRAYDELMPEMTEIISKKTGRPETDRLVKARAFDNLRYLLPAGTGTNLAIVANPRDLRHLIRESLSHTNPEIVEIGQGIKKAIGDLYPVFVEGSDPDDFEPKVHSVTPLLNPPGRWSVNISWGIDTRVETERFFYFIENVYKMTRSQFDELMERRGKRAVPKVFRDFDIRFDAVMDFGAFRDLQRHRRCEITYGPLTRALGFEVPDDIVGTNLEQRFKDVMQSVDFFEDMSLDSNPELIQYIIPIGYLHHSCWKMDLAQVYYMTELRTQPQGHISYRRPAYEMFKIAQRTYPELMKWCRAIEPDTIGDHA